MQLNHNVRRHDASDWSRLVGDASEADFVCVSDLVESQRPSSDPVDRPTAYVPTVCTALDVSCDHAAWPVSFPRLKRLATLDVPVVLAREMSCPASISDALVQLQPHGVATENFDLGHDFQIDWPSVTIPLADDRQPFDRAVAAVLADLAAPDLVRAGLLLGNGQDDASHRVSQSSEGSPDYDYWHGLMHRREPDFGNAGYWFRRVGNHDLFAALPERLGAAFDKLGWSAPVPESWDPFEMLRECERALDESDADRLAQTLVTQQVEYAALLRYVANDV